MPRRPSEASNIYDIASTNILGRINDIRTLLEEEEWDTNTQRLHETLVSLRNKLLVGLFLSSLPGSLFCRI